MREDTLGASEFVARVGSRVGVSNSSALCRLVEGDGGVSRVVCHADSKVLYIGATCRRPDMYMEGLVEYGGRARGRRARINLLSLLCAERVAMFTVKRLAFCHVLKRFGCVLRSDNECDGVSVGDGKGDGVGTVVDAIFLIFR